ncbi:hypothetical protein ACF0H5_022641 [Mactra antiquata]
MQQDYPTSQQHSNDLHGNDTGIDNLAFNEHIQDGLTRVVCENRDNELHEIHNGSFFDEDTREQSKNRSSEESAFKSLLPFCIIVGTGTLFSQSVTVYLSSQITVLERAFGLSSSKSGLLLSANDIGFVVTVLLASHLLKNHHIPRILAICIFTFGISGILTSLPHFIIGDSIKSTSSVPLTNVTTSFAQSQLCVPGYHSNTTYEEKCLAQQESDVTADLHDTTWVVILIGVMMALQGVAKSPRVPLSSLYVDNNSEKERTGFYIGILMSFTVFGPFLAITAGGFFNKLPVDLTDTSMTPEDPRWIGAWWLGFIVFGACSILISVPIFFFPESLRKEPLADDNNAEYVNSTIVESGPSCSSNIKDLPKSIYRVLKQPVFTCNLASTIFVVFAFMSMGSFGPKYVETQFQIPTWKANVIAGLEKLVTTCIGTFLGGVITRRLRLGLSGCVKMILLSRLVSFSCQCFNFIWGCDTPDIIGFHTQRSVSDIERCECNDSTFLPVCLQDHTYYSPCHAGCTTQLDAVYSNCSGTFEDFTVPGRVNAGFCPNDCYFLIPFIAINAFGSLIGTMTLSPSYVTTLRSVKDNDRSVAVGLQSFLMALLVFLPAPIVYGKVFDSVCLIWNKTCLGTGSCSLYDIKEMRHRLTGINIGMYGVSLLLTCCTCLLATRRESTEIMKHNKSIELKPPVPQPRPSLSNTENVF